MKKEITLYSLDKEIYPDTTVEVEIIEDTYKSIEKICDNKIFPAIKSATVQARKAKAGEIVDTRPRVEVDGKIYTFSETKRTVTEAEEEKGAMIIINPDGEEYLINSKEKFDKKYKSTPEGYIAIDGIKHFSTSTGNYAIKTSWGEEQIVLNGSYFCVENITDIYGVTNTAFYETYTRDKGAIVEALLSQSTPAPESSLTK